MIGRQKLNVDLNFRQTPLSNAPPQPIHRCLKQTKEYKLMLVKQFWGSSLWNFEKPGNLRKYFEKPGNLRKYFEIQEFLGSQELLHL